MTLAPILEAATREDADEQQRAADLALLKDFAIRAIPVIDLLKEARNNIEGGLESKGTHEPGWSKSDRHLVKRIDSALAAIEGE